MGESNGRRTFEDTLRRCWYSRVELEIRALEATGAEWELLGSKSVSLTTKHRTNWQTPCNWIRRVEGSPLLMGALDM